MELHLVINLNYELWIILNLINFIPLTIAITITTIIIHRCFINLNFYIFKEKPKKIKQVFQIIQFNFPIQIFLSNNLIFNFFH